MSDPDPHANADELTQWLRERFGEEAAPRVDLRREEDEVDDLTGEVIRRLTSRDSSFGRYELKREIGRGGQGAVLKVWDSDLRRDLAMKVLADAGDAGRSQNSRVYARTLGRFVEEAQVTGQLDHPGIVPVHELGLDGEGRVYFTMKLVRGRDLEKIFDLVHEGKEGWTLTRAVGLLLKVCEAMAYAHHKGVLHRDLKPANIMVGRFGAVYVMDWGIARVIDQEELDDLAARTHPLVSTFALQSERKKKVEDSPESPHATLDGDVLGTPAYMSPEQARGKVNEVGPQADVYSVGAMLYHLLTGQMPYVPPGSDLSAYDVWRTVCKRAPRSVRELAPNQPAALLTLCERAMQRECSERYDSMQHLADDLQAFLEGRVAGAPDGGSPGIAQRSRALPIALTAAIVLIAAGLGKVGFVQAEGRRAANEQRVLAENRTTLLEQRLNQVLGLSALEELDRLEAEADRLWPVSPALVPEFDDWIDRAEQLVARLHEHRALRDDVRQRGTFSPITRQPEFVDLHDAWWHGELAVLVERLEELADYDFGLLGHGIHRVHGWGMQRRRETAERMAAAERASEDEWARIGREVQSDPRLGFELKPQAGLVPLGRGSESGLFEFWHVGSGERPRPRSDGTRDLRDESGFVLLLVPGGSLREAVQAPGETPRTLEVEPFFISKYELTPGQWRAFTDSQDQTDADSSFRVDRSQCREVLGRLGLDYPTEAQWQLAAREIPAASGWTAPPTRAETSAGTLDSNREGLRSTVRNVRPARAQD